MSAGRYGRARHRDGRLTLGTPWRWLAAVLAGGLAIGTVLVGAPAVAAPVYEIDAQWAPGTPATVKSGDVVTGVWRVNVNDDAAAPANDPVDNVTVTVTAANGRYTALPSLCLTKDVTPASSISADGHTLVCNLGTHDEGTAVTLQAPIVADGATGSQVTASGSIGGASANLSPITITNRFGMDMRWASGMANPSTMGSGYFTVSYEWTLSKALGGDAGPQSVVYNLTISSPQGGTIQVDPQSCAPYSSALVADGHPWSGGGHPANQTTGFPSSCTLVQTGANSFQLTLTGIDYAPSNVPTLDSAGNRLPTDQVALASGSIWLRVLTTSAGSATLTSNTPTYTSTTGQTAVDDPSNNTESKSWTTPGTYSSGWGRGYTNNGGTTWDDTYRVSAGTTVGQYMDTGWQRFGDRPGDHLVGMCSALDTRYVTFERLAWGSPPAGVPGATTEYYTGSSPLLDPNSGSYDPNAFDCTPNTGWTTTLPADATQVKGVRIVMTQAQARVYKDTYITAIVFQTIKPTVPAGTDIWSFFSGIEDVPRDNWWNAAGAITSTPGSRYPNTTGFRDVLRIVTAEPSIVKSVDRSVVSPGQPATYTLTYSANGAGAIPATVDGFQLVDTLPAGTSYVAGSASPQPAVSTNGSGQQVLTWMLNGVGTNADHALTYQAVADSSVTPGAALTNAVTATYAGISKSASAQVTVATDGYTTIGKVATTPFIPNTDGKGNGSGSWTVTLKSFDPVKQPYTDTIDILPYVGDGRGTAFSGAYTIGQIAAASGATVYYTTTNPASLSDDPAAASNGSAGSVTGNTVGWSTTYTKNATAIRVIGPALAPGATQEFTVPVTTAGAKGGDTLVNRAQARDGNTKLVMRTSAAMTVANYYSAALKKEVQDATGAWHDANDVTDYPTFRAGDQVHYRITVTNTGQGTLTNIAVHDDKFSEGDFTVASLEPGKSTSFDYFPTLNGGGTFVNTACATADTPADSQQAPTINCDPAGVQLTNYTVEKSSNPASGATVHPGDRITYTVTVKQQGDAPAVASFTDSLAKVLDDATYQGDVTASIGSAAVSGSTLSWNGTVPVGQTATITYSVIVKGAAALAADGDYTIGNQVTSAGCVDAASCATEHEVAAYRVQKTSDPATGSNVEVGSTIDYTITVIQQGEAAYPGASLSDDLSGLLDDATWNDDLSASAGTVAYDPAAQKITWTGDLAVGQKVTITYSVTVTGDGDTHLLNAVTSDGCFSAADCTTEQWTATYTTVKTASPASGADVQVGDTITYTVTVTQAGLGRVVAQFFRDDLTNVTDDATFDPATLTASAGTASYDAATGRISWTGNLGPGDVATVTYKVVVTGKGDTVIGNTVTSPGCESEADCTTVHHTGVYSVEKTADPASGSSVQIGDTVKYTVTVRQHGTGPVNRAAFSDDLSKVLDDATWNGDLRSTDGGATYTAPVVDWSGRLAVGDTVTVTYSVTVTGAGDMKLDNVVTSDGCAGAESCSTEHLTGDYTVAKTSAPAPGADVKIGDTITYTVTVTQHGPGVVTGASAKDDLSKVLDDATWNDDAKASSGTVKRTGDTLTWSGDLAVGAVVTITYTVTVTGAGDMTLTNTVAPGDSRGECVPAPDQNPDCSTTHKTGNFTYSKMSDPASPATVAVGDTVTYTVTVTQVGPAAVPGAALVDDLSGVLDDATFVDGSAKATAGTVARNGNALTWTGDLAVGQVVTITYQATVKGGGDTTLHNTVAPPPGSHLGECVTAPDGTPACETTQKYGGYVFSKTADPKPGATVKIGDTIHYTVTVAQTGTAAVTGHLTDDLSKVLDDASWNGDEKATAGTVERAGDLLTWTGPLGVGGTVTITYSVTVTGDGDQRIANVVTSPDATAACVPAADGNPGCATEHTLTDPPAPAHPNDPLAATGATIQRGLIGTAVALMAAGVVLLFVRRRRRAEH
ncbi:hypothetical protein [uncultured Leifsonia sp.]|uniref:DUF7927 domain-containing protein n=1 Tax=uncultured Leifsonia sp. TaxID=340359 RepID=UPI0028D8777B|nr:hypothetical protein [uncultured Leifsonia sp.]